MSAVPAPRVKICGLTDHEDARAAAAAGADFLGVVLAPGGRRSQSASAAAGILAGLGAKRVGVFVNQPTETIVAAVAVAELDVVQLHGHEDTEQIDELRAAAVREIWKAIRPRDAAELLRAVARYAPFVDALLVDGWSADAYGGTGARAPWQALAEARAELPASLSLVLAGGLAPHNVAEAVKLLRPYAVDVSSGVEGVPGRKDRGLLGGFVAAARAASGAGGIPPLEIRG
jgi:phosphoribosylanthranilate isomerase